MQITIEEETGYRLRIEVIDRSKASIWSEAKLEWTLIGIEELEVPKKCLCGHAVRKVFVVENSVTGVIGRVGSSCIKILIGTKPEVNEATVRTLRKANGTLAAAAIEWALGKGWINIWERNFYRNVRNIKKVRSLTPNQLQTKQLINSKVRNRLYV